MKKSFLLSLSLLLSFCIYAQDAYHSALQLSLQNGNNLPAGDWVFFDNEDAIMNGATSYGSSASVQDVTDQDFSKKVVHNISQGANAWNAGWNIRNKEAIQTGDKMLLVFNIRSIGGVGKVNVIAEHVTTFNKEIIFTLPISEEWNQYLIPFESSDNYAINTLVWGFHLAFEDQTIEIGGFTALNYNNTITLDQLPNEINNEFYGGWEPDAPWRATAADQIDQLRKANLTIQVNNSSGDPVADAAIDVKMTRHEFAFGSAITANRIAGNNAQNDIYENKIINLDGEGHGFNWVVFENDMKWPAWEDEWFVNKTELVNAVQWLRDNDVEIRGHNLVWPGENNLPSDINANLTNIPYIQNRINTHIEEILTYPGIAGNIAEWDVINEIITNTTLANTFQSDPNYTTGRELYGEIFQKAKDVDPNIGLWLNDFVTISQGNTPGNVPYDQLKQFTQEIVDANAPIDGIGFQAHVGGFPNSIYEVLDTYDDFYNSFGLKAKITEFDLPTSIDDELAADYLVDFLTATFSHESMDGFLFWSFWDGATYMNEGSNLYNMDWTLTEAATAYIDLIFNQWWTDEIVVSNNNGVGESRVFKGTYEISYTCDGDVITETVEVLDPMTFTIVCDNISTDVDDLEKRNAIKVFPNPTNEILNIKRKAITPASIQLTDLMGRVILKTETDLDQIILDVKDLNGIFFLSIESETERFFEKIIITK